MGQERFFTRWYELLGHTIRLQSQREPLVEELGKYLNIPAGQVRKPNLSLDLRVVDSAQVDQVLPLPKTAEQLPEFTLLLNRPVVIRSFRGETEQWNDYQGYARSYIDFTRASALVVLIAANDILPLYSDMLFTYNLINQLMMQYDHYAVHACCVESGGTGIMIAGNSGRGKSTAVFALLQQGFKVLSDERVLLYSHDSTYRGCSISDIIKVRETAREQFFPDLPTDKAYGSIEDEHYFRCDTITPGGWFADTEINYFLIINRTGKPDSSLAPINPTRAVGEFFPVTMKAWETREAATKKFNFLMDFLSATPCFQLDFGTDMAQFSCLLRELAEGRA